MTTTRGQHLLGKEIGSCVLEKLLGYGGTSAVFLACSRTSGELVAVKVFLPRSTLDGQMRKSFYRRFLREAEAVSQLDHPSILPIYAYGEHEGLPYIIMPYMVGGTLSEHVKRQGPLSLHETLHYLEQIGAALDYAHTQGCIHCDVKPANILLDSTGRAALSDFGTVRLVQTEDMLKAGGKDAGKSSEILMGTPDYLSPEQALGEDLDGRSDVYSLGATLYYLLTGDPPFQADTLIALTLMHIHETAIPLGMLRADVTPQIDLVLAQALAKIPAERFQTASAFYSAFAQAIRETGEVPRVKLKPTRPTKKQASSEDNIAALPALLPPIVQIKPLNQPSIIPWRTGLTLGLVSLLLLGSLLVALFIRNVGNPQPAPHQSSATPNGSLTQPDVLLADQQDWPTSSTFFFRNGRYYIQKNISSADLVAAFYANHQFTNFHLAVVVTETTGSYNNYGVAFRASADQAHYYLFEVTTGNGGQYEFLRFDGTGNGFLLASGATPSLRTHVGQPNVLDVDAQGNTFTFAINGQRVGQLVHDLSHAALFAGEIGLIVEQPHTEVAFSNLFISPLS
ncbi:MAG: protein kinase [Ktedonobacteraceae bacterium]